MHKRAISKLFLSVCLNFIFFDITACATHSVWQKTLVNPMTVVDETYANADGFYSKCKDIRPHNKIIIPFKANESNGQFPPFEEGLIIISSDKKTEGLIQEINEFQTSEKSNLSIVVLKADFLQKIDPDKNKIYSVIFENEIRDRYRRAGYIHSDDIKINFIEKTWDSALDLNCEPLTKNPVRFDVTFKQGSLKYSEYENTLLFRIIATPAAIIIDAVTSPFQLIAILTVPIWYNP